MTDLYDEHAWLYDAAFSDDVEEEVEWLLDRLGAGVRSLLEPGCGSGRMMPAFARRGIEVVGVDRSEAMLARARTRLHSAGLSYEDEHLMRAWDWPACKALIASSPFRQLAAYDGNEKTRPRLALDVALQGRDLIWHELERA